MGFGVRVEGVMGNPPCFHVLCRKPRDGADRDIRRSVAEPVAVLASLLVDSVVVDLVVGRLR